MSDYRFYTPDGVSDLLVEELAYRRQAEAKLRRLFTCSGYQEIQTPGIEFYDVYAGGAFVKAEELYKLTDQEGRLLALRYDGTVPSARLAATLLKEETLPLRLAYLEPMYRFRESGGGRQREFLQAGIELMGVSGAESEAEVISLAIKAARETGLEALQVSIGQPDFFRGLMEDWGIPEADAAKISAAIDRKDILALEEAAHRFHLQPEEQTTLLLIPELFGTYDTLERFSQMVSNPKSLAALENLKNILDILGDYDLLDYISIDLGMLSSLDYYTGVIFKGFTYEVGFPIISGGRYDQVVSVFGRELSAVGFSMNVDLCLTALQRQGKAFPKKANEVFLTFSPEQEGRRKAFAWAEQLRQEGLTVVVDNQGLDQASAIALAKKQRFQRVLRIERGQEITLYQED